jgi:hypothetical protein
LSMFSIMTFLTYYTTTTNLEITSLFKANNSGRTPQLEIQKNNCSILYQVTAQTMRIIMVYILYIPLIHHSISK